MDKTACGGGVGLGTLIMGMYLKEMTITELPSEIIVWHTCVTVAEAESAVVVALCALGLVKFDLPHLRSMASAHPRTYSFQIRT